MKRICTCYRCGKIFYSDEKTMEESKKLPQIPFGIIHYSLYGGNEVELCYSCRKELYKWMYGREFIV